MNPLAQLKSQGMSSGRIIDPWDHQEPSHCPPGPVKTFVITDEMRAEDAAKQAARQQPVGSSFARIGELRGKRNEIEKEIEEEDLHIALLRNILTGLGVEVTDTTEPVNGEPVDPSADANDTAAEEREAELQEA